LAIKVVAHRRRRIVLIVCGIAWARSSSGVARTSSRWTRWTQLAAIQAVDKQRGADNFLLAGSDIVLGRARAGRPQAHRSCVLPSGLPAQPAAVRPANLSGALPRAGRSA